ncbi:hypothetical protein WA026_007137 [Henosepilachna vigintioctopunctata]|uniref:NADH dehydrogenase [ubiquinone] 1 beta subcomplex subunit 7 n=1 Tax=Henosepilachna vigintioctopunctata TaxID=420089 RepID=A0AAW1VBW4_9CUCU
MGQSLDVYQSGIKLYRNPDIIPSPLDDPTFDPNLGFKKPRTERVMIATDEEMRSAKIPLANRDYCAHKLIEFKACRKENWPFPVKCQHEKHAYLTCQYEDFIMRMKEYEREKRLRLKAKKGELEI